MSSLVVAPPPKSIDYSATLATTGQGLWGTGDAPAPVDIYHPWFDQKFSGSGGFDKVTEASFDPCFGILGGCTVSIGTYGAAFTASVSGEIGMGDTFHGYQPGKVDVSYPMKTRFTTPADDSFAPGDTVDVTTRAPSPQPASSITTTSPTLSGVSIDGTFGFHASASGKICVVSCLGGTIFSLDIPGSGATASGSILSLSVDDLLMVQNMGLSKCFGIAEGVLLGATTFPNDKDYCNNKTGPGNDTGYVKLPDPQIGRQASGAAGAATTIAGTTLSAHDKDQFLVVPISAMKWIGNLTGLPIGFPNLSATFNGTGVSYTTMDLIVTAVLSQTREVSFTPVVNVTMDFGRKIDYSVVDPGTNNVTQVNSDTKATFPLGSTLRLVVPDAMTITPTLSMFDTAFHNHTFDSLDGTAQVKALSLYASIGASGPFPGIDVKIPPLYDSGALPLGGTTLDTATNKTWQLGGFNKAQLAPFNLVPDPPPTPTPSTVNPVEGAPFTNQVVGTFHDPDTHDAANIAANDYTASITWGDGHTSDGTITGTNDNFTVSGTNTYEEEGSYPVDVTVTDVMVPTSRATAHSHAVVADAALTVTDTPKLTSTEGAPTTAGTRVATFTDADPHGAVADFSASIAWGDGSTDNATVVANSSGGFDVLAPAHTYEEEGSPTVVVSIADAGGARATTRPVMTTSDAALTAGPAVTNGTSWGTNNPILLWPNPGNAVLATFTDDDPHGTPADFTAVITWGDGSTSPGTVASTTGAPAGKTRFSVTGSHTYTDAQLGQHPISVLITDDGGASTTARTTLLAYAFPTTGGVFALGDRSTQVATSSTLLNFWGSSWAKTNTLTAGAAPNAFKGYIANPPSLAAPPSTCPSSTSFTTGPGTSAVPPGTVPSYMAVLVTSQVNKDGSVISSNQGRRWVVVHTSPGYGPAAGHDGTATIAAGLC
ncbi:hypothetical protein GCM10027596_36510 [Nocardioides korecus]